jgi:oligoendopeptidase F
MLTFIPSGLKLESWETIKPFFNQLLQRDIASEDDFRQWLSDRSELEAYIEEDAAWRYIRMTIDTRDEALTKSYTTFVTEIQPNISPQEDALNRKMRDCPYFDILKLETGFDIYFRSVSTAIELFRDENVPLEAEIQEKSQQFGAISGAQTIEHEGSTLTMQKAGSLLREQDEKLREGIYRKMVNRRNQDVETLHDLYTHLIQLRHKVAVNAGFENYRDYKFKSMGRFDYSKEDCFQFHQSVREHVVPMVKTMQQQRLKKLGKDRFRPWDLEVDPSGLAPLKPFRSGSELVEGAKVIFNRLDPFFHDCLDTMSKLGYLDLDSKAGKAPGGYNYPLYQSGYPFIFMNAVGTQQDLVTMVHEGGHAVHSVLTKDLPLTAFKNLTSEIAELASMSMELLSMKHWDVFYNDPADLKRAKRDQMESIIKMLPWIAQIDEFQHWVYENPSHDREERSAEWIRLSESYGTGLIDWEGFEEVRKHTWQRQLHLFEVPFYYIEYGIAQLGALGVWKNSLENESLAIQKYKDALSLGYTMSIPRVFEKAGVPFDFSAEIIGNLMSFVQSELNQLKDEAD